MNTVPRAHNTTYLLKIKEEDAEHHVVFDTGSRRLLNQKYVHYDKLRAIFLSHAHLDHTVYLGLFLRKIRKSSRKEPLYIVCHENGWKSLKWWIRLFNFRVPKFVRHVSPGLIIKKTHLKDPDKECQTDLSQIATLEPITLSENLVINTQVAPALHSVSSVVYRLNISHRNDESAPHLDFMFSPDTSYTSTHLVSFAKNAAYWLLDAAFSKEEIDKRYRWFEEGKKGGEVVCHSGPHYSGKICEQAEVKTYIVGHYCWDRFADDYHDAQRDIIRRVKETFSGNVVVSLDLVSIPLQLTNASNK